MEFELGLYLGTGRKVGWWLGGGNMGINWFTLVQTFTFKLMFGLVPSITIMRKM